MSKKLQLFETKKLHYNKYLYKLQLRNPLNTIFRSELQKNGPFSFTREKLDELTDLYRRGEPLTREVFRTRKEVSIDEYLDAKDIYTILKSSNDYKIRVEPWPVMIIYSNDRDLLIKIANKIRSDNVSFWEPTLETASILVNESNTILIDNPTDFPIRVTFNTNKVPIEFANWLRSNRDKSRIGDIALSSIETGGWCNGLYFHVRDEKILNLINLIVGRSIRRVDKLIYKGNIDKY